jgi:CHAT domain-containing protein
VAALRAVTPEALDAAARARAEVARLELELPGITRPPVATLLENARTALDPSTAILAFHTGDSASWLWSLDREGLTLHPLPPRGKLAALVNRASEAVRGSSSDTAAAAELFRTLFGGLGARVHAKTRWMIALDRGLFEAPLAALPVNGRYLVEQHVIQTIPGAGAWLEAAASPRTQRSSLFVGVGDAIYNTADSRLSGHPAPAPGSLLLPRLVGSAREVEGCARQWKGERVLLKGVDASRDNLRKELAREPAVIHFATHVLESGGSQPQGLIALSLTPTREDQLLPPQDIASWRTKAQLVVLSGCHSASSPALPGTGLLGLTRAWLASGADAVIASNWPTPDENGALFHSLYRHLSAGRDTDPSMALRSAQLDMIHAGDWRSAPRYWGAYFAVGVR